MLLFTAFWPTWDDLQPTVNLHWLSAGGVTVLRQLYEGTSGSEWRTVPTVNSD